MHKNMDTYKFRYFFDPGSGICLWSENDLAREKFGYPVDIRRLGLPLALASRAAELVAAFDASIDWNSPSSPSPWAKEEQVNFQLAAASLLCSIREHLGPDFEIRDCS
jgi:hypothetical protein